MISVYAITALYDRVSHTETRIDHTDVGDDPVAFADVRFAIGTAHVNVATADPTSLHRIADEFRAAAIQLECEQSDAAPRTP